MKERLKNFVKLLFDTIKVILFLGVMSCLLLFVIGFYRHTDETMKPNINKNDILITEKISKHTHKIKRKDIVLIYYSKPKYILARVIGLPGEKIELKVRLYDADGKCVTGNSSPDGFSYVYKLNPILPGENTLSLSGWGGADRGHFVRGTYRYEVWYEDMCLKSVTFNLK